MEHLSSATVNAIVKQIKDLQKNPAEGITVRFLVLSLFLLSYSIYARCVSSSFTSGAVRDDGISVSFPLLLKGLVFSRSKLTVIGFLSLFPLAPTCKKTTGKTDRIERTRRVRGNSRSREHAV